MYERFYNLRERPFSLSPDPDYLYPSRVHTEALNYLRYGIEGHAGFVVVTGEIGSGKTTLLQTVLRRIDRRTSVARLVNTQLDARELIEAVMIDFGLTPQAGVSKPALIRDLARFLVEQRSAGRLALLIVDEAQNLSPAALEEIRMLSNLETEKSKLIQIVLVGQPNLQDVLSRPEFEQLRQRVTVRYHLRALDLGETSAYINHRLKKAAIGTPMEFSGPVTELIGRASQGLPRRINIIADATLLFGYGENQRNIDVPLVQEVLAELQGTGVLPVLGEAPEPEPAVAPGIVPVAAVPASARAVVPDAAAAHARAELQAREEELAEREARISAREGELAEQHRILQEQYRLLKTYAAQTSAAQATVAVAGAAPWPPPVTGPAAAPRAGGNPIGPQFAMSRREASPTVWTRMWRGLLGFKPLED
jgi:putative secretion ATPase (PEP-CTERM system associated)